MKTVGTERRWAIKRLCNSMLDMPGAAAKCLFVVASLQRFIEAFDQGLPVDGLAQETYCSGPHRSRPNAFFVEGRDENDRRAVTSGNQKALQLDPAHAWHLNVSDHAR